MPINPDTLPDKVGLREFAKPVVAEFMESHHYGNATDAANAMLMIAAEAIRQQKPHTTPGQPPAQAQG